ncbi:hypothetical protein EN817_25305 [Mesorhizobium sp. M3A.F.Ca.ET.174.01.1.1]|nr:hypothetical protein EN844_20040 [Mesorhizobium sp. M3A.F.Ca.ET.201.01.1.1]TGS82761.1 hypothetical protein EN818_25355 [Mesorhizobium sp. M3A.F.Ca.ET.175.01.1.1]TGT22716.1 hypothetical protein EN817_25305 [Mesorhizobium sp. M3A.F.Ca.ET.174.01.1.1]
MNDMRGWLSARTFAEAVAWSKVIVEEPTYRIVGAHLVGDAGEELIHIFALARKHGIPARSLSEMVDGFPTGFVGYRKHDVTRRSRTANGT